MSTVVTLGPVGFKPTGAYDNTREYKKLDVVIYQGSSYIAKSDSIGQLPTNTTYWELLVQKGEKGEKGEKGDPGEVTDEQLDEAMARANMVYNALPKVSDEGDNLTLDGTANCPMKMELKGNTEQTTYTGKNLLTYKYELGYSTTIEGITWTINQDGTITANGTASSLSIFDFSNASNLSSLIGKTVIMNGSPSGTGNDIWVGIYTSSYSEILKATQGNDSTSALIDNTAARVIARIPQGTTVNNLVFKPMVRLSSVSDTTYEPYVGGTPSPNPDYPQDVRVVTGNNSVNVIGKNLLDKDNVRDGYRITQDGYYAEAGYSATEIINVKPNTTYSTSWTMFWGACVCTYDKNDNFSRRIQNGTSFTTTSTEYYIRACVENNILSTAQIEIGSSSSSYQPYQSQTYPINLGTMELCKIPNTSYQDIIFHAINGDSFYDTLDNATKQTLTYGKWYKHSEIGKVVLDGSENWSSRAFPDNSYLSVKRTLQVGANGGYCDNFTNNNQYDIVEEHITLNKQWNEICFAILKSRLSTPDGIGFKNWLSTHNTTAYYILATPTNEEITDTTLISQLNAIENAVSYDTQTNIVQENYSEPFIINAECVRSLKDIFELID